MKTQYRTHTCGELSKEHAGQEIMLSGWVHHRRDHGGIIFIDLRDHYGITQIRINPENKDAFQAADSARREFVLQVKGLVEERPADMKNDKMKTGEIEIDVKEVTILSQAITPPFEIDHRKESLDEELRLTYRYLDLRRKEVHERMMQRHQLMSESRKFMEENGFIEAHTPILSKSSPEGARDFLVPSRLHPGQCYALPQAPQQYKQFLMLGGFDKYYQIAPCFRDEDPRADRLPGEFYQLDLEMAFVSQEDLIKTMEEYLLSITKKLGKGSVKKEKIERLAYKESITQYGTDKPDLRYDIKIIDITEELKGTKCGVFASIEKKEDGALKMLRVPFGATEFSRKHIDQLTEKAKQAGAGGLAYVQCKEDGTFASPLWKFLTEEEQAKIIQKAQDSDTERNIKGSGDIVFFGVDKHDTACTVLGAIRVAAVEMLQEKGIEMYDEQEIAFAWITDFPMYEWDEDKKQWDFTHNPFSAPQGGLKALETEEKDQILAYQFDCVANGYEICSGGLRNSDPAAIQKAFEIAGHTQESFDQNFGHLAKGYEYGAPPHGGMAFGLERFIMILQQEKNIRNVVPFPKNQKAEELLMQSPSVTTEEQQKEIHIKFRKTISANKE